MKILDIPNIEVEEEGFNSVEEIPSLRIEKKVLQHPYEVEDYWEEAMKTKPHWANAIFFTPGPPRDELKPGMIGSQEVAYLQLSKDQYSEMKRKKKV
jgi:hypothetical protein